ncbi:hypothetical protein MAPG_01822 [Magnaporthiopsis poae ATCC 64411]|uniref:Uncharacterized protein n=1 Tax=Magnaporthiopsis poae (strain ATCC 64411 / 73-15) TaxID=644358 RepID=A0A0C4DPQ1_MAGP6|nr:hypothetical protein MAPG_01822 [Magnaporthiopsis poae ATCC 64411]
MASALKLLVISSVVFLGLGRCAVIRSEPSLHPLVIRQNAPFREISPDGRLSIGASTTQVNWGDLRPYDAMRALKERCLSACGEGMDFPSKVVIDGKPPQDLTVHLKVMDSAPAPEPPGDMTQLFEAMDKLARHPQYTKEKMLHYDHDTEDVNCPAPANTCWIDNKMEGDLVQFFAPDAWQIILYTEKGDQRANLRITATFTLDGGSEGVNCDTLFGAAAEIGALFEGGSALGLVGKLYCGTGF